MRTGDLARQFGVSDTTIRKWTSEFAEFFSDTAKAINVKQRVYTEDDILILATVAKLSVDGLSYHRIKDQLKNGFRVEHPGIANFGIDTRMVPAAAVEQIVDATEIRIELERISAERDRLLQMLEQAQQELKATREHEEATRREKDAQIAQIAAEAREREQALQNEIRELMRELGRAEGKLEEIERNRKSSED